MSFERKIDSALKVLFKSLIGKDQDAIMRLREDEQDKLTNMGVKCIADGVAFCDNESLLIQSMIVDELLIIEEDSSDLESKLELYEQSLKNIV